MHITHIATAALEALRERERERDMLVRSVFSARHAGTGDGYRCTRERRARKARCAGPTQEMRIRRQRGRAFRKSRITILAREKNRVGSGFPWAAHERPASRFCRPALVHTFHVALYLLLPPCPRLPSLIHPPAFHLPFAGLAHSFARSRVPASHWIYRFELPRESQTVRR